jgi:hypothetical protein
MNCSFNIRYKPRTTRAFTKSDLTVYDSAGNTALNALTVYGKSEVVNDKIVSAGEGWGTVDLGTLDWATSSAPSNHIFRATLANVSPAVKPTPATGSALGNYLCGEYLQMAWNPLSADDDGCYAISPARLMSLIDHNYDNVADFVAHISGVMLAYELVNSSQGNAIAIKTDNGSGIDGTMAVFETGTPLYGVSDSVRDVMVWDGSAGTVTKNCNKVKLTDLTWQYSQAPQSNPRFYSRNINSIVAIPINVTDKANILCTKYVTESDATVAYNTQLDKAIAIGGDGNIYVVDKQYTTVSDFVASLGDAELVYELATPTTTPLTTAENASIAGLRTFAPTTHAQNNAQTDMTLDYTIRVPTI